MKKKSVSREGFASINRRSSLEDDYTELPASVREEVSEKVFNDYARMKENQYNAEREYNASKRRMDGLLIPLLRGTKTFKERYELLHAFSRDKFVGERDSTLARKILERTEDIKKYGSRLSDEINVATKEGNSHYIYSHLPVRDAITEYYAMPHEYVSHKDIVAGKLGGYPKRGLSRTQKVGQDSVFPAGAGKSVYGENGIPYWPDTVVRAVREAYLERGWADNKETTIASYRRGGERTPGFRDYVAKDKEIQSRDVGKKVGVTMAVAGLGASILFIGSNLTGNVIGSLSVDTTNFIGVGAFLIGIVGAMLCFRKSKK